MRARSYLLYVVVERKGYWFLPMLSDTFVPIPGNYISRVALSLCGLAVGALGLLPFFDPQQPEECLPRWVLLAMSTCAGVLLGVVGAVCEFDDVPTCMGSAVVHDISATSMFLLYDVYAVVVSLRHSRRLASRGARFGLWAALIVQLVCKLRFLPAAQRWSALPHPSPTAREVAAAARATSAPGGISALILPPRWLFFRLRNSGSVLLACVEYLDTISVFAWVSVYCGCLGRGYQYGFVRVPARSEAGAVAPTAKAADNGVRVLASLSLTALCNVVAVLAVGTIGGTFALALAQGVIHPRTGVHAPVPIGAPPCLAVTHASSPHPLSRLPHPLSRPQAHCMCLRACVCRACVHLCACVCRACVHMRACVCRACVHMRACVCRACVHLRACVCRACVHLRACVCRACVHLRVCVHLRACVCARHAEWPMISDLWVVKPSDMLSRYLVCLGAALLALSHCGHHVAAQPYRRPRATRLGLACGLLSTGGLMLVGVCNERETGWLHSLGAVTFFAGFAGWALADLCSAGLAWRGASRAGAVVSLALLLGSKLAQLIHLLKHRCLDALHNDAYEGLERSASNPHGLSTLEWLATIALLTYYLLSNHALPDAHATRLAFFTRSVHTAGGQ